MYRSEHKTYYRTLPIHMAEGIADPSRDFYTDWFIRGIEEKRLMCFTPHCHETLELIYVTDGRLHTVLEGQNHICTAGTLMTANPFSEHSGHYTYGEGYMHYIAIQLELSCFIPPFESELHECIRQLLDGRRYFIRFANVESISCGRDIVRLLFDMFDIWKSKDISAKTDCTQMAYAYELLHCLIDGCLDDSSAPETVSRDLNFIRSVTAYLEDHYAERLTTSSVCEALSYNLNHFCRAFRANFSTSFTRYLCEYRIAKALYSYRNSTLMPGEIAAAVGFRDYGYFAREFRKYTGVSPSAFYLGRKSH